MRKIILNITIITILLSCSKKSDQPKPQEAIPQTQKTETKLPDPYYQKLGRPFGFEDVTVFLGDYFIEKYIGHDDSHVPKADLYFFQQQHVNTTYHTTEVIFTSQIRVWWLNGVPKSDSLVFKKTDNGWMQTRWQFENVKVSPVTLWDSYSYK